MPIPDIKHEVSLVRESLGNRKKGAQAMDIIEQKWDELEREYDKVKEQLEKLQLSEADELDLTEAVTTAENISADLVLSPRAAKLKQQSEFVDYLEKFNPNSKDDVIKAGETLYLAQGGSFDAFNAWVAWAMKGVNFAGYSILGVQWIRFSYVSTSLRGQLPEDEAPPNG